MLYNFVFVFTEVSIKTISSDVTAFHRISVFKVCPTVEDGPKLKLPFWYPVSQFSSDCHEILQPLLSNHLASTLKISRNYI